MKKTIMAIATILSFSASAEIVETVPVSYVFDMPTDSGTEDYADHTGEQLTDGLIHTDDEWLSDVGRGYAYDIVGWGEWAAGADVTFVNIDFSFGDTRYLDSLSYGAFTDQGAAIYAPDVNVYALENGVWELKNTLTVQHQLRDETISTRDLFTIDLGFYAEQVRFEAVRTQDVPYREHNWTFIDEIDFFTNSNLNSAVSVNTGFGATGLLMAGLLGFSMRKRNGRK